MPTWHCSTSAFPSWTARYANTRLVALTGYGQETDRRRSAEAGFDVHLVKPIQIAAIVEILRSGDARVPEGDQ